MTRPGELPKPAGMPAPVRDGVGPRAASAARVSRAGERVTGTRWAPGVASRVGVRVR
jgi:hypothetical protein